MQHSQIRKNPDVTYILGMSSEERKVLPFQPKPEVVYSTEGIPVTFVDKLDPPPRLDLSGDATEDLIAELEAMDFECPGWPLPRSLVWQELRRRLGYPAPPRPANDDQG